MCVVPNGTTPSNAQLLAEELRQVKVWTAKKRSGKSYALAQDRSILWIISTPKRPREPTHFVKQSDGIHADTE